MVHDLEIGEFLSKHGDAARDVAFEVEDLDAIFDVSWRQLLYKHLAPLLHINLLPGKGSRPQGWFIRAFHHYVNHL